MYKDFSKTLTADVPAGTKEVKASAGSGAETVFTITKGIVGASVLGYDTDTTDTVWYKIHGSEIDTGTEVTGFLAKTDLQMKYQSYVIRENKELVPAYDREEADRKFSEKPQAIDSVLQVSKWSNNTYSFEEEYPHDSYDVELFFGNGTSDQYDKFGAAKIIGSSSSNVVKALGDIPDEDIPIIIQVIKKGPSVSLAGGEFLVNLSSDDTGYYVEVDDKDYNMDNVADNDENLAEGKYNFELL